MAQGRRRGAATRAVVVQGRGALGALVQVARGDVVDGLVERRRGAAVLKDAAPEGGPGCVADPRALDAVAVVNQVERESADRGQPKLAGDRVELSAERRVERQEHAAPQMRGVRGPHRARVARREGVERKVGWRHDHDKVRRACRARHAAL